MMVKRLGFILLFVSAGLLKAMDSTSYHSTNNSGYVIKTTGLGAGSKTEIIYDPDLAAMMVSMRQAEAECYARQAQERKDKAKVEAAKNEKSFGSGFKKGFLNKEAKK